MKAHAMKQELNPAGPWEDGVEYLGSQAEYHVCPQDATPCDLHILKEHGPVDTAVLLKNQKNITLDFNGATLALHGKLQAFVLEKCENITVKNVLCYLDACASAVGVVNGVFILLRYREQWIAWYIVAIRETVINIMVGQWILLVLKAGYLTNTTYGYIKWTKYIKTHTAEIEEDTKRSVL